MSDSFESQAQDVRENVAALDLLAEQVNVSRRIIVGDTVRVSTTTHVREQQIVEMLARETIDIERVAIGRIVETTPDIRQEGDVTIVPVMEEVLVLERRLVLMEEVRIRRVRTLETHCETVQLRHQAATVTRSATDAAQGSATTQTLKPADE